MTISSLIPTLQPLVEQVNTDLRVVCFFILTSSIIVRTSAGGKSVSQLMRPIVTSIFICGLLATLPFWFNLIRDEFWNIAVQIRVEFTGSVAGTGAALLKLLQVPEQGGNWLDISSSLMKAVQFAFGWMIVCFAGMIQLPMMIIQYVMECLCYLFLPIALCLFAFESTKGLAIRYVQQTLSILAWPIGFAVVDLVGFSLLTTTTTALTGGAISSNQITLSPSAYVISNLVAIWLILGSLATPVIMQMLFCSGVPLSSSAGHAFQTGLALAGVAKLATGGAGGSAPASTPETSKDHGAGGFGSTGSGSSPAPSNPQPYPNSAGAKPGQVTSSPSTQPQSSAPISNAVPGVRQTPRGSLAVGQVADAISPAQAQSFADKTGVPFTQALSSGQVVTYQPAVSKVPPASTLIAPSTSNPIPA